MYIKQAKLKLNSMVRVRERTISTEWPPLVGEISAKFADIGCHVVRVMDPYGHILAFLARNRYFFFQQLLNCTHEAKWSPFQTN
jgi:hypothetical protein